MVILDLPHSAGTAEASVRVSGDIAINPPLDRSAGIAMWHVAVTRPGMFPMAEARCPCEKAPCGLVIPRIDVPCAVHTSYASLHQAHSSEDCRSPRTSRRGRRSGLLSWR